MIVLLVTIGMPRLASLKRNQQEGWYAKCFDGDTDLALHRALQIDLVGVSIYIYIYIDIYTYMHTQSHMYMCTYMHTCLERFGLGPGPVDSDEILPPGAPREPGQ